MSLIEGDNLVAGAIPAAAAGGLVDVCGVSAAMAVHDVDAEKSRSKEEDGSQEQECEISSELVASVAASDAIPVPD